MAEERHADPVTLDHIIDLRKQLAEAERQRDNALNYLKSLNEDRRELLEALKALGKEEDRNC